jgi:hypothetical protein
MRHHINVSLALILGLVAALNTTPLLAMQEAERCEPRERVGEQVFRQDCDSNFSEGLEIAAGPAGRSPEAEQIYAVRFTGEQAHETGAYIPERFNSEAMVVRVFGGRFAFRVQGPDVIVDPQGQPLERLRASIPIRLGENPNVQAADRGMTRTYNDDGEFRCDLNPQGQRLCLLDPADFTSGDTFVRLDPGDTVFLPENSTCFLCNTDRIDPTTGKPVPSGGVPAELLIWTPTTGFNQDLERAASAMATSPQDKSRATPTTQRSGRIIGWMFNPGSRCN